MLSACEFFKQKKWNLRKVRIFQIFLGLKMTNALLTMMYLTIISTVFILMSWNPVKKMRILVEPHFWIFQWKSMIGNLQLTCLIKEIFFPFYINPMSYLDSNILSRKCFASFCSAILRIEKTTINPLDMVTRFNFLLMRQGSECTCIVSLLEKIFGKHFSQNIFSDTADKFIKFWSF